MKGSFLGVFFYCTLFGYGQEHVEKKISSEAEKIIIDFDVIDHIQLFNSEDQNSIVVQAEGSWQKPGFDLKEIEGHVLLSDHEMPIAEELPNISKVCIEEPNYTSYKIYIPENRNLYISFMAGNFYADNFKGDLSVKIEDGVIKLNNMQEPVKIRLNAGSVFVRNIKNTEIDAETNMGVLVSNFSGRDSGATKKKLLQTIGTPNNSLLIRSILANIYLYGSKD